MAGAATNRTAAGAVFGDIIGVLVASRGPLKENRILFGVILKKDDEAPFMERAAKAQSQMKGKVEYYVAFEQPDIVTHIPACTVLTNIRNRAAKIVERVSREIVKKESS